MDKGVNQFILFTLHNHSEQNSVFMLSEFEIQLYKYRFIMILFII